MSLSSKRYLTVKQVLGPLIVVEGVEGVGFGELVKIVSPEGEERNGQVLEIGRSLALIQVFEGTTGLDTEKTAVKFTGETMSFPVSSDVLGRVFNGVGEPIDGKPMPLSEEKMDVNGSPINPWAREFPKEFIQTGISAIDGMNTLVRGQKLPIFSASGLPHGSMAAQIIRQAKVLGTGESFAVVFAAMGITFEEADFFIENLRSTGALSKAVLFLNLADDPAIERVITPRVALTVAEYLAYEYEMQILVVLVDMTNYCEALREISAARGEVPGRRGYPGYMYTDLARIYERAGRIHGRKGSVTQIPILTMPHDDITHPIPDLTGYITEGQVILSRDLHRKGIYPPINVLPSLSRLMARGVGEGRTREDHLQLQYQLMAAYSRGTDLRDLVTIVGEEALTESDRKYLAFADLFERVFVSQGINENREIERTLNLGWKVLAMLPEEELTMVDPRMIQKYHLSHRKV